MMDISNNDIKGDKCHARKKNVELHKKGYCFNHHRILYSQIVMLTSHFLFHIYEQLCIALLIHKLCAKSESTYVRMLEKEQ